jgi:hypothetical protein
MRLNIPVWSRLTRVQRILLGVVVLIVVLFIVTESIGVGRGDGDPSQPGGLVTAMGQLFGKPPPVAPADLSGSCLPTGGIPANKTLPVNGSCILRVAKSADDLRQLALQAKGGVTIQAPVPRGDDTATKQLADGDKLNVSVNGDGADITLTCVGKDPCAVVLS